MATFTAGTSFTDGVTGDVTAAKLNALVANATPLSNFITDRTAETSIATDDLVLISDTSESGALNKMTVANFTNIVSTGTGTAADPAIRPTGDTNTGAFFPAADTVGISTGGIERFRVASSGNVGIGITAPDATLTVEGSVQVRSTNKLHFSNTLDRATIHCPLSDTLAISTASTERLRIDSSGRVGIGTSSPQSIFNILKTSAGNTTIGLALKNNSLSTNTAVGIEFNPNQSDEGAERSAKIVAINTGNGASNPTALTFWTNEAGTNSTERLRIDSSGNVGIGVTNPAAKLEINGKVSIQDYLFLGTDRSGAKISIDANLNSGTAGINIKSLQSAANNSFISFTNLSGNLAGSITHNGTTTVLYNASSDYRLKEITGPVVESGSFIDELKPVVGYWKEDGSKFVGFLAHEFAEVSPSSVTGKKDEINSDGKPIYQSMQASSPEVIANIVAELQSIRKRIVALESA